MTAMLHIDLLTLFAVLGIAQALFFAIFILAKNHKQLFNKVLALLLLVTSIRIAKNIVVHIREIDPDFSMPYRLWRMLVNIGLTHQFAIGPLFFLYFLFRIQNQNRFSKQYLLHFIPFATLLALSFVIEWNFWKNGGLWVSYIHILIYYLFSLHLYRNAKELSTKTQSWLRNLLLLAGIMMLAYSPALFKYMGYINGALIYTIGIYFATSILLGNPIILNRKKEKYESSALRPRDSNELKAKLETHIVKNKPYLDPDLTLTSLANQLDTSPNYLSQVINEQFGKNFSDFINAYRIETVKEMLTNTDYHALKIASLAFDSGFNSLATFNALFKKQVGMTPSAYRKQISGLKNA